MEERPPCLKGFEWKSLINGLFTKVWAGSVKRTTEMINHWRLTMGDLYHCKAWSNKRNKESYQSVVRARAKEEMRCSLCQNCAEAERKSRELILQVFSFPTLQAHAVGSCLPNLHKRWRQSNLVLWFTKEYGARQRKMKNGTGVGE